MSATETQDALVEGQKPERELLTRAFSFEAHTAGDGRTIDVRVVPFDEVADVADPPDFRPYKEQFMPGVFSRNEPHAHRVLLRFGHHDLNGDGTRKTGLTGVVGRGVSLKSANTGYEGTFRFLDTTEADTARELVEAGSIEGVSAEFVPIRSVRTRDGVVQRQTAHLDSVSLALQPAYSKSEILALREEQIVDEDMLPPPPSKELLERCEKLGIDLPEGMATLLTRAYTEATWDGSASRWATPDAYCSASAIDLNKAGMPKRKALCHLPYKEPGSGTINVNAVRAALSRIGQGYPQEASQAQRDSARATLERILASFKSQS